MITLEQLSDRLEILYSSLDIVYREQFVSADNLFNARQQVKDAKEVLGITRSAAIAAQDIQTKEHGSNQNLRDAHERDYLNVQYLAVTIADKEEELARHKFDNAGMDLSALRMQIRLTEAQVSIVKILAQTEE